MLRSRLETPLEQVVKIMSMNAQLIAVPDLEHTDRPYAHERTQDIY